MNNTRLTAGTAQVDITTLDESHINDRLYGRILTLCQEDITFVIIALDAVAIGGIEEIPDDFLERLRNELKSRYNIKPEHLLLSASHTHTAPPMIREPEDLLALLSDAVGNALDNLEEVEFGYGAGCEKRIAVNRAIKMQEGSGWAMRLTRARQKMKSSAWAKQIRKSASLNFPAWMVQLKQLFLILPVIRFSV